MGPAKGREVRPCPREVLGVVSFLSFFFAEFFDVEKADLPGRGFFGGLDEEFVFADAALFSGAAVDVFHALQSLEVKARLGFTPTCFLAQLSAAKEGVSLLKLLRGHLFANEGFDLFEEAARLGWEFIK